MVTKKTKGYTKSKIDLMKLYLGDKKQLVDPILKSPDEPLDKWIIRKTEGK